MATMRAAAVYHRRAPGRNDYCEHRGSDYSERKKFSRSCFVVSAAAP
jgi:hypothetical protein